MNWSHIKSTQIKLNEIEWNKFYFNIDLYQSILNYNVILIYIKSGEKVNIEVDVLAKMVERSLAGVYEGKSSSQSSDAVIAALEARVAKLEEALQRLLQ